MTRQERRRSRGARRASGESHTKRKLGKNKLAKRAVRYAERKRAATV